MTRKVIEHWWVWMAADVIYIWLYAEPALVSHQPLLRRLLRDVSLAAELAA